MIWAALAGLAIGALVVYLLMRKGVATGAPTSIEAQVAVESAGVAATAKAEERAHDMMTAPTETVMARVKELQDKGKK